MFLRKLTSFASVMLLVLTILMSGCAARPGTLPDPKTLPAADRSDVGTAVTVSLDALLAQQPGDEKAVTFAYVYNGADKSGRLAVFTHFEHEKPAAMLTVYEPESTGVETLFPLFETEFKAKIVDRAIVSAEENRRLHMASYRVSENTQLEEREIIPALQVHVLAASGMDYYFGHVSDQQDDPKCYEMKSGNYCMIVGGPETAAGKYVSAAIENLKTTAKRFGLEASLGM